MELYSELKDWTSDVEINENSFDIDFEPRDGENMSETHEDQSDQISDFPPPLPCSPLPAATEMVNDLWDDNDEYSDDDDNYDQEYARLQVQYITQFQLFHI